MCLAFVYLWDDLQFDKCFPSYYFGQKVEVRLRIVRSEDCVGHMVWAKRWSSGGTT